jgi:hypothetical protein
MDPRSGVEDMKRTKILLLPGPELWSLGFPASGQSTDYAIPRYIRKLKLGFIISVALPATLCTYTCTRDPNNRNGVIW